MMSLSRMIPLSLVAIGLCTSGCSTWRASHGIQSRSARAGDGASPKAAGTRVQGDAKLTAKRGARPGDAMHYYANQRIAMIARPARYNASELARVEVWWTDNNGFHWHKAGRFEQGQAFFPLDVREDGDYGVRFVGPGEEPAQRVLAFPERTYHVDTVQPEVQVLIDPEQADYHVGDLVSIDWMVQDFQLEKHPVTIEVLYDRGDTDTGPVEFQRDLPDEGTVAYSIPPEALGREITFRIEARDRSGNLGIAYTGALRVVEDPMAVAEAEAEAEMNESEIDSTERVAVATPDEETESDTAAPVVEEEEPVLVVGPILVPIEDGTEETVTSAAIDSDLVVAGISSGPTVEEQRATTKAMLTEVTRLSAEMKLRATMFVSRVIDVMGGAVDSWVTAAKMASARERETPQSPPPATVAVVESPVAVAVVEADDAEVGAAADAETPEQEQVTQAPPTFAVVEQPLDESAAEVAVQETLVANAAETDAEETDTNSVDSTVLEFGPKIVMAEEPVEEEPAHDLPFATAIARLPAIDPLMINDDSAAEDFPTDGATTRDPEMSELPTETTEPMQEEGAHPQVSALASAEQETNGEEQADDTRVVAENLPDDEQLVDATVAAEADDASDEQDRDSDTIETVAAAEQSEDEEPFLPALSIRSLIAIDPTRGNGLLVPLPATLEEHETPPAHATAHPWRILGRQSDSMEDTIWTLPERRSDVRWRPVFTDRFLADDPAQRDVAEPGNAALPTLAGTTEEAIDGDASDEP